LAPCCRSRSSSTCSRRASTSCCAATATRRRWAPVGPARAVSSASPARNGTPTRKAAILLNATAGALARLGADRVSSLIGRSLAEHGVAGDVELVDGAGLKPALRRALGRGIDFVLVGGGDGTINTAAALLAGTGCPLGVIPLGTFNHLAKELLVPAEIGAAVDALAAGVPAPLDIAEVNGRIFVSHSALGIYPRMVRHRDLQRARFGRGKWLATAIACAAALRDYPTFGLQIRLGAATLRRRSPLVFIGNNRYILESWGIEVAPRRDRLTIAVAHDVGRAALCRMGIAGLAGRLRLGAAADTFMLTTAEIHSRRPHLRVEIDGEVCMLEPPLSYRLRPGALTVLRPPSAEFPARQPVDEAWTGTVSEVAGNGSRAACASGSAS
jgi:diacylglycerol kinase family enzyme